ncbi:MAG: GNAT family N-acetyltransferase [Rhizobiaceae bacterium]
MRTGTSLFHHGGQSAYKASKSLLAERSLPPNLELVRLDANSPSQLIEGTVKLCQNVGLSTMPGEVMRGEALPGACFVALNGKGMPVATASSYAMHAKGTPREKEAFWGVLATHEDFRGQGLAGILGAIVIEHMWEEQGMRGFNTGIKADNLASRAACAKLAVLDTAWVTLFCFDDSVLNLLES